MKFLKRINNSLVKNTGIYTINSIINSAIPFFLLPILTRYLKPEEYGIVSMFTMLVTFTSPFIGIGVNGAIARQYYNQEEVDIWEYIYNCFIILIVSSVIVSSVFLYFGKVISQISSFPIKLLWTVVIYSLAQFIINIVLTLWQVQKKSIKYSVFNIFLTGVNLSISIILVVFLNIGWTGRVYGQLIATVLFAILSIVILVKNKWIRVKFNKKYLLNAFIFGLPLIPHALSGSIISMTDRLFITNMVGLAATGVYSVGYQIGSIIKIISMSFNKAYVPWLYEKLKLNSHNTNIKIVKFTYSYFAMIILGSILLGLISPYILNRFLGKEFNGSSIYVIWIALGYAFNGMYLMVVNYIFYAQKTKFLAMVTFITALLNLALNYLFIKEYGAIGAAQATTITFLVKFLIVWMLSNKVLKMPWNLIKQKEH